MTAEIGIADYHWGNLARLHQKREKTIATTLSSGENNPNAVYGLLHNTVVTRYFDRSLPPNEWTSTPIDNYNVLISHKSAQKLIKRALIELGKPISIKSVNLSLVQYVLCKVDSRVGSRNIHWGALAHLTDREREAINHISRVRREPIIVVLVPWYSDNPALWKNLGVAKYHEQINPWGKAHECGVIFVSQDPNHSLFHYHFERVARGEIPNLNSGLIATGRHEGSHGITDEILRVLLSLSPINPLTEMFAGIFGKDNRESKPVRISFCDAISNPFPVQSPETPAQIEYAYLMNYHAFPKVLASIYNAMSEKESTDVKPEATTICQIVAACYKTALVINQNPGLMSLPENERTHQFMRMLIENLGLDDKDVAYHYHNSFD